MSGPTKDFWDSLGLGLLWLGIGLGIGSCNMLSGKGDAVVIKSHIEQVK